MGGPVVAGSPPAPYYRARGSTTTAQRLCPAQALAKEGAPPQYSLNAGSEKFQIQSACNGKYIV